MRGGRGGRCSHREHSAKNLRDIGYQKIYHNGTGRRIQNGRLSDATAFDREGDGFDFPGHRVGDCRYLGAIEDSGNIVR